MAKTSPTGSAEHPVVPLNTRSAALAELHAERRRCIKIRPRRCLRGLDRDCQSCEELLITARQAVVPARPTAARGVWQSRADEEFGGPSGHPETPRVERTRTPWDKLEPGRGIFGSRQTRSFWGIDVRRAPTGISGRCCQSANGAGRRNRALGRGLCMRHSVRLESACYEPYVGPRVIQRSSANGLAERATAASSARALPRRLDDI
jgi:hypothetical protein